MSFVKKEWKDRIAEYINRRRLTHEDGNTELVEVARDEGDISQEGDAFNAETMNDLEERIYNAVEELDKDIQKIDGSKLLSTSILDEALRLGYPGTFEFQLNGSTYSGNDLPSANYAYGSATVHRRSESFIDVTLHGCVDYGNGVVLPMAKNYYNKNHGWSGWQVMGDMKNVPTIQLDAENKIAYITANVG